MNDEMRAIKELRDRVNQLETAVHILIEAVQIKDDDQRRRMASDAFERMPL